MKKVRFTDAKVANEREALARNVKYLRGDMKVGEFAKAVGLCPSTVAAIEAVERYPMLKTVLKISNAAGAPLKELFQHTVGGKYGR